MRQRPALRRHGGGGQRRWVLATEPRVSSWYRTGLRRRTAAASSDMTFPGTDLVRQSRGVAASGVWHASPLFRITVAGQTRWTMWIIDGVQLDGHRFLDQQSRRLVAIGAKLRRRKALVRPSGCPGSSLVILGFSRFRTIDARWRRRVTERTQGRRFCGSDLCRLPRADLGLRPNEPQTPRRQVIWPA